MASKNKDITVFHFNKASNINKWYHTNDDVMGGVSNSKIEINENGKGVFSGYISLENNGGFAMTRLPVNIELTKASKKIVLKVKGDNKTYQLRIKFDNTQSYWYIYPFRTTTEVEEIDIPLKDFYPSYRGNTLNLDNFSSNTIKEIAILIGNKKEESFKLIIDEISIK